jgi:hypothetical protein
VAIVDNASTSGQGEWQYRASSMATWDALPSVSAGGARLVASTSELRFVPAANFNGTPGGLTVRLVESPTSITHGATVDLSQASSYGSATAYSSATVALGTSVTAANDAPSLSATGLGVTYLEQAAAAAFVSGTISVCDPDAPANFFGGGAGSLTVALDTYQSGDTLSVLDEGTSSGQIGVSGTTISYGNVAFATTSGGSAAHLVITFTSSTATPAAVQALLGRLRFANSSNNDPTENNNDPSRVFTVTLDDGGNTQDSGSTTLTASITGTITITAVNDAPVLVAGGTLSYTENGVVAVIDGAVTISDADDTQIAGATVTLSAGFTAGDELGFVNASPISGSYNTGTGVLTLSGTGTVAQYEAALRSVT